MISVFIYSFIIFAVLNAILLTFSYIPGQGKSAVSMSELQLKVLGRQANIFEIILCYIINVVRAIKNIFIYLLAGLITLIWYLITLIF